MSGETDSKGRPIDQQCRYCGKLFTAKALRKHVDRCPGPDGVRVCDLSGAARARRIRVVIDGVKKKKKRKSVFTVSGGGLRPRQEPQALADNPGLYSQPQLDERISSRS